MSGDVVHLIGAGTYRLTWCGLYVLVAGETADRVPPSVKTVESWAVRYLATLTANEHNRQLICDTCALEMLRAVTAQYEALRRLAPHVGRGKK